MGNIIEEEDEGTRFMRMRSEEILQAIKASTKENIKGEERLMKLEKGVAKADIDRANKILEKHLGNTNNIYTAIDAVYAMGQTIEKRGMKKGKKIKNRKDQIGGYENSKSRLKNRDKSWLGHQMKSIGGRLKGNRLKNERRYCKN